MDMYQKRKMRKEKSINKKEEVSDNKVVLNLSPVYSISLLI